jgi:hypothetical protein
LIANIKKTKNSKINPTITILLISNLSLSQPEINVERSIIADPIKRAIPILS